MAMAFDSADFELILTIRIIRPIEGKPELRSLHELRLLDLGLDGRLPTVLLERASDTVESINALHIDNESHWAVSVCRARRGGDPWIVTPRLNVRAMENETGPIHCKASGGPRPRPFMRSAEIFETVNGRWRLVGRTIGRDERNATGRIRRQIGVGNRDGKKASLKRQGRG